MDDGLKIARERIEQEGRAKSGALDLANLGLAALPDELFALPHLESLRSLDCSDNAALCTLPSLQGLENLEDLDCSGTQIRNLAPLADLKNLKRLYIDSTPVASLAPLETLTALTTLDFGNTDIEDLSPLMALAALSVLTIHDTRIKACPPDFWLKDSLKAVYAVNAEIQGLPGELLSKHIDEDCLPALRAHAQDLGDNPERLSDIKLMILGNGRIGKTQICNRLRGQPFEENADSTHGIVVTESDVPGTGATFNIWDFGGQDIYFGTHILFLKSRAVFMLVWTPESDDAHSHDYKETTFRNQPVSWWLDYARRYGNRNAPILVVQNQLDLDEDRGEHPSVQDLKGNDALRFCRSLAYSAKTDEGRDALDTALQEAAENFNAPYLGRGRMKVIRALQALQDEDRERPKAERVNRTLDFEKYLAWCKDTKQISNPEQFLHFLHNAGIVFWRKGHFENRIVLDQEWILDATYAVFARGRSLDYIRSRHGQFSRSELALLVWEREGYSEHDQKLFLSFLVANGICFELRSGSEVCEPIYAAPDHLPANWHPDERVRLWGEDEAGAGDTLSFESLPPTLMRNIIVRIGTDAGLNCAYWRNGFCGHDSLTDSRVLVEQTIKERWQGSIRIETKGPGAPELLDTVRHLVTQEAERLELIAPAHPEIAKQPALPLGEDAPGPALRFKTAYHKTPTFFISYNWADLRIKKAKRVNDSVQAFFQDAKDRGIDIHADIEQSARADRFGRYLARSTKDDRIIIILSQSYLKSAACMNELHDIWAEARGEPDAFRECAKLFFAEETGLLDKANRAAVVKYWQKRWKALCKTPASDLGKDDIVAYALTQKIHRHVGDILATLADVLDPQDLDALTAEAQ